MHLLLLISLIVTELAFGTPRLSENAALHKKRKVFVMGLILFLFAALRDTTVGIDVPRYAETFEYLSKLSFAEIWEWKEERDPVFSMFGKVLTYISPDPQMLLVTVGAIVAICFSYFAYHQQSNTLVLYILFVTFRMYAFTLTGLRQAIALSLCWVAFVKLQKRQAGWFILLTVIASLFHASAITFLVAWPIYRYGRPILIVIACSVLAAVDLALSHRLVLQLTVFVQGDRFEDYAAMDNIIQYQSGGTQLIYFILFAFVIIVMFYAKERIEFKQDFEGLFKVGCLALAVSVMCQNLPGFFRISYYYMLPFYAVVAPAIKAAFNKRDTVIVYGVIVVLLCAQYVILTPGAGINEYRFFWS